MTDNLQTVERIDLRFRAPQTQSASWLPGGTWLWFAIGLAVGAGGWLYTKRHLQASLAQQVEPNAAAKESLHALEALGILGSDTDALLVRGLEHTDTRVARTAWQKLGIRIDQWSTLPLLQQQAQVEHLVKQLSQLPSTLPDPNQLLVRSLAAKLYALCVAINDPKLQATMSRCQLMLSPDNLADTRSIAVDNSSQTIRPTEVLAPPEPLPNSLATRLQSAPVLPLDLPQTDSPTTNHPLHDTTLELTNTEPTNTNDESQATASSSKPELPALVKTPASVASYALPRIQQDSDVYDLGKITKIEIAELVRLLASDNPNITKAATLALRNHGLNDYRIELATELATGSAVRRIELIQQLAISQDLDPRPWLVWMAEDGQPEVRRTAVSLLSSMMDPEIERSMRMLLFREQDEPTRDQIRKVLLSSAR